MERRRKYTFSEDQKIITYVEENVHKYPRSGNKIWKNMQVAKVTEHSWQSMRTHYIKFILPNLKKTNNQLYKKCRIAKYGKEDASSDDGEEEANDEGKGNSNEVEEEVQDPHENEADLLDPIEDDDNLNNSSNKHNNIGGKNNKSNKPDNTNNKNKRDTNKNSNNHHNNENSHHNNENNHNNNKNNKGNSNSSNNKGNSNNNDDNTANNKSDNQPPACPKNKENKRNSPNFDDLSDSDFGDAAAEFMDFINKSDLNSTKATSPQLMTTTPPPSLSPITSKSSVASNNSPALQFTAPVENSHTIHSSAKDEISSGTHTPPAAAPTSDVKTKNLSSKLRQLQAELNVSRSIIFHALIVCNGDLNAAQQYLKSQGQSDGLFWSPEEDAILRGNNAIAIKLLKEKRGAGACLGRCEFLNPSSPSPPS